MAAFQRYHTASGWTALSRHKYTPQTLNGPLKAAFVVIGAGFSGLSTARQLATSFPDRQVVLLDADEPMQNSSARNSGFMIDLPYTKIDNRSSTNENLWQIRLMQHGRQQLRDVVDKSGFDCGWRETGHYKAAVSEAGAQELAAIAKTLDDKNIEYRTLSRTDRYNEMGTDGYCAALWLSQCTLVQTAELVHAALTTLPENVSVYFNSPVVAINKTHDGYRLRVGDHDVVAKKLALCVNTNLPMFGVGASRQLSMYTYACITRSFDESDVYLGDAEQWGVTPVERLEATTRKLSGNRLMLRIGFSHKRELSASVQRELLLEGVRQRYPQISGDDIEQSWGGAISMTRNGAPLLKMISDSAVALSGCNASGILKMTALGTLAADLLTKKESPMLSETLHYCRPSYIPPEPMRSMGVAMTIRKFKHQRT